MKKILVILGPTATGKTDLAIKLAQKFNGELIACDSRQVYKGLDIGTGKMPGKDALASQESEDLKIRKSEGWWEINGIKIWLYDLVEPTEQFTAFDWSKKAKEVIKDIESRGRLPILVGGTGLYLKALLEGLDYSPADQKLRSELEKLTIGELQSRVATLSPARWEKLNNSDRNNPRRLVRIIEQVFMNPYIDKVQNSKFKVQNYDLLKIGLSAPRPWLNSKIDSRVLTWFNLGILEEVKKLIERGVSKERFKEFGLEYGLIAEYLVNHQTDQQNLISLIQTKIRQYAKRQMTWFKRDRAIIWFDVTQKNWQEKVATEAANWYNKGDDTQD